jgi:hypothetical protein
MRVDGRPMARATDGSYRDGGAGFLVDTGAILARGFRVQDRVQDPDRGSAS